MVQEHKTSPALSEPHKIFHIYRRLWAGEGLLYAWFAAMHTRVDIVLCANKEQEHLMHAVHAMQGRINEIERKANCFDKDSELARVNASAAGERTPVSEELEAVLSLCVRYNEMTNGLFDVMAESERKDHDITRDLLFGGDGTVTLRLSGLRINLSGMIKGYAAESLRPILRAHNIKNALVNIGNSSVMAIGSRARGSGWIVGMSENSMRKELVLHDRCLTTSGNDTPSRQHIIDPRNGQYKNGRGFVSVVTDNAADGEALSTTLFIAPEKSFPAFGDYTRIEY